MSKEIEADKAAFDALLATSQGEEVMAVVPAGIEPGTVTIREGGLETEGQPETPAEQPETQPEEQETPPEQPEPPPEEQKASSLPPGLPLGPPAKPSDEPPAVPSAEPPKPGLIIWKNFLRKP